MKTEQEQAVDESFAFFEKTYDEAKHHPCDHPPSFFLEEQLPEELLSPPPFVDGKCDGDSQFESGSESEGEDTHQRQKSRAAAEQVTSAKYKYLKTLFVDRTHKFRCIMTFPFMIDLMICHFCSARNRQN